MNDTPSPVPFQDRLDAGGKLAKAFVSRIDKDAVVFGLPRGGVIVAAAFAQVLGLAFDVYVVRKLSAQNNPEFAFGALAEDGPPYVDEAVIKSMELSPQYRRAQQEAQHSEVLRQVTTYRGGRRLVDVTGRQAVIVDDGIATGATAYAGAVGLRTHNPSSIVVTTPVSSTVAVQRLAGVADEVLVMETPCDFVAVGQYYQRFDQVNDTQVANAVSCLMSPRRQD